MTMSDIIMSLLSRCEKIPPARNDLGIPRQPQKSQNDKVSENSSFGKTEIDANDSYTVSPSLSPLRLNKADFALSSPIIAESHRNRPSATAAAPFALNGSSMQATVSHLAIIPQMAADNDLFARSCA